ncbi:phenylpyruvate tautomerase PptA (4-oxalocrotonate tautomerase family) [Paraburkholderia sp. JPY465]
MVLIDLMVRHIVGACETLFPEIDAMPYLQLDVNDHYSVESKRLLAAKMSETYARMMSVDVRRISVAIRELGPGGVWRIAEESGEPVPVALMMLDIRRGRPPELRMELAKALCSLCIEILGLREDRLNVEFTQHSGDEMYHPALGGYSPEWEPGQR